MAEYYNIADNNTAQQTTEFDFKIVSNTKHKTEDMVQSAETYDGYYTSHGKFVAEIEFKSRRYILANSGNRLQLFENSEVKVIKNNGW